ncbi:hypothetical protein [Oceanicoccus sagamiensis]|uniref:Thioredoxin domain-containing protein n=1 Tax=Oceanicoccus sagamiensis TaxID=716816 RepID=A0A1X9N5T6_9GAMM|nr:hypothetical protein [Oceanicoccus sagamiensis]ARN73460.1 hypothetical protein BST96_04625 [Oceanicoccus sagamiensis]
MLKTRSVLLLTLLLSLFSSALTAEMETVKTKNFEGDKFVFPKDIKGTPLSLLFLAMGKDQENGTLQQQQQIEWHKALAEKGILNEQVAAYHFPVMESPPFFVKGIIRSAMADAYEGTADLSQSGVLYIDDLEEFAKEGGLTLDELPTLVLLSEDGKIIKEFKGVYSEELATAIAAAINAELAPSEEQAAVPNTPTP